jgi:hypothetical protein
VIISMPELVALRVVSGMSADRAVEVGADALSYPTTTRLIPNTLGPLDSPVQPWPARLTGAGLLTMTLPSSYARPMWTPAHGQLRQPGYSVKQRMVNPLLVPPRYNFLYPFSR